MTQHVDIVNTPAPIDTVLGHLTNVKTYRNYSTAQCPVHGDTDNSLIISEDEQGIVKMHCFAGCTPRGDKHRLDTLLSMLELNVSDLYPSNLRKISNHTQPSIKPSDFDLMAYLDQKRIHPHVLAKFGVEETRYKGQLALKMPYYDLSGKEHARFRIRTGEHGFAWGGPSNVEPIVYGLWRLPEAKVQKRVFIVEGESDTQTLVQFGYPALGIPGATLVQKLRAEYFTDIDAVYIIDEQDSSINPKRTANIQFLRELDRRFKEFEYAGAVQVIPLRDFTGYKDPNELNVALAQAGRIKEFRAQFDNCIDGAMNIAEVLTLYAEIETQEDAPGDDAEADEDKPVLVSSNFVMNLPPATWLISGVLPQQSVTMLLAKEGSYKSFMALDWVCSIATGRNWNGHQTAPGRVVYIASEGLHGYAKRLRAWIAEHGGDQVQTLIEQNLQFVKGTVDLIDQSRRNQLLGLLLDMPEPPALVVFDTLAESIPGGDENSSKDMGTFISAGRFIRKRLGACVLVVHHKPKNGDGSRGHSSLPGALDMRYEMDVDQNVVTLTCTKARDVAKLNNGQPIPFRWKDVVLSEQLFDSSGILEPVDFVEAGDGLNETQRQMLDVLSNVGRSTYGVWQRGVQDSHNIGRTTFDKHLKKLVARGDVSKSTVGIGHKAYYEIAPADAPAPLEESDDEE